jgi:hypothetical protein
MKVTINSQVHDVPPEQQHALLLHVQSLAHGEYLKLEQTYRLLAKPVAREILRRMEESARKTHGKEVALFFRTAKGKDPVLHLSDVFVRMLEEVLKRVEIGISTEHHTVTALNCSIASEDQPRGPLSLNGHIRERENDGTQVS